MLYPWYVNYGVYCFAAHYYLNMLVYVIPFLGVSRIGWATCFKIIKGICQGLHFLHKEMVVHMNLFPDNILLDDNMVPKIAEFGLSRLFGEEQTRMFTQNVVGPM